MPISEVQMYAEELDHLIDLALREDLDAQGDVTSNFILDPSHSGTAVIIAKEKGIICGISVAERVFQKIGNKLRILSEFKDGDKLTPGDDVLKIAGSVTSILTAERTALNFLQRLSGIATMTAEFVGKVQGTHARILDTRKTTPTLRKLEKYAVATGGGVNHRMGLFDMILIKENHIAAAGGITSAVKRARRKMQEESMHLKLEVETRSLQEVAEAVEADADRIMLDNMHVDQIREAVNLVEGRTELEVSGGVTLASVAGIAATGVDFISVGALTHSAKALDLSLLISD